MAYWRLVSSRKLVGKMSYIDVTTNVGMIQNVEEEVDYSKPGSRGKGGLQSIVPTGFLLYLLSL